MERKGSATLCLNLLPHTLLLLSTQTLTKQHHRPELDVCSSMILSQLQKTTYTQITKSREAYETQQTAFLHRQSPTTTTSRARPQSAGGNWNGSSRERSGDRAARANGISSSPPPRPPHVSRAASPGGVNDAGRGGRASFGRASFDHPGSQPFIPPPAFSRLVTSAASGGGGGGGSRLGKPRTRVRPNSANARAYGRPGAGHGVGGSQTGSSETMEAPRRVHVPRQGVGCGSAGTGDGGKAAANEGSCPHVSQVLYILAVRTHYCVRLLSCAITVTGEFGLSKKAVSKSDEAITSVLKKMSKNYSAVKSHATGRHHDPFCSGIC